MTWYRVTAKAGDSLAELFIYDLIDDAGPFVKDLAALPSSVRTIKVRVNSPGGSPFAAVAIANALRSQRMEKSRRVEVAIEGLAASAATLPPMAGDTVTIARNALAMIHSPVGQTVGDAGAHREMAAALDRVTDAMIATYRWRSRLSDAELRALMSATTWLDAEEAVSKGFATEVGPPAPVEARHRPEAFATLGPIPARFQVAASALVAGRLPAASFAPRPAPLNATEFYRRANEAHHRLLGYVVPGGTR